MKQEVMDRLVETYDALRAGKPNDRSDEDRHWAIVITEMEKLLAYFDVFIFNGETYYKPKE